MPKREIQPIYDNTYQRKVSRRWWMLLLVVVIMGAAGFFWWQQSNQRQLSDFPVKGIEVSQETGYLDFQKVQAAKISFVYLNATSGAGYTDDNFASNYGRLQGTTMGIGVIHSFSFTTSAAAQFQNFNKATGGQLGNLPVAINVSYYSDYNDQNPAMTKQEQKLFKLVQLIENNTGRDVVIMATQDVLSQLVRPVLPTQPVMLQTSRVKKEGKLTRFINYDDKGTISVGGKSVELPLLAYNGSKVQFSERYGQ